MTAADRMAGFLDRQFRQRVDFDALVDVADQGDCNLPCSPADVRCSRMPPMSW